MTELNAIKARLGSISDTTKRHLPPAVLRLLNEDMPQLIMLVEQFLTIISFADSQADRLLNELHPPNQEKNCL